MRLSLIALFTYILANNCMAESFTLTSPNFKTDQPMSKEQEFNGFGCSGGNHSPALAWSGIPDGTKSLALTVYDPDAPTGSGWWHWLVFNIPADTKSLIANINADGKGLPTGAIQSRTDFGEAGFGGACPPQGDKPHHYQFTLYALKTNKLELTADAMPAMVGYMLNTNSLGKATLVTTYQR
ncbi:YbhB/YbcL family Raf kinase inhibitor-like protein [uncultured Thiothrix sp.]|uniref:YbhB/YbcL family Raf kinase inhibitor-like protein n=1 Tax=uncultured Thiothrix sp. TaxID=223185 RepID=UPI0026077112|nr:YbhB/YbcL family Raf kinase inhibitor-like protein [uncultured Thiothrix sp.]